ncbi:MAG: hypothetical protein HZC15_05895 [Candidatus Omnitrophica bacterium]|nr:hypothetical protein [Candidatus Omnitrophota bacterium]
MSKKLNQIAAIILSTTLIFQQVGFAQVAAQLDLSSQFVKLGSQFVQDKFRPVQMRYFSYDVSKHDFQILLDMGNQHLDNRKQSTENRKKEDKSINSSLRSAAGAEAISSNPTELAQDLLNYFLIGVTLPDSKFWVNLRPDSQDNIIDDALAKTDVGKSMLEADLQLKKDTANFTSPQTSEGKLYWDKLYKKAKELFGTDQITIPTLTRPWIVPGEIIIQETVNGAYIYKAGLKVMLEEDYLKQKDSSLRTSAGDPSLRAPQGRSNLVSGVASSLASLAPRNDENGMYQFNDPRLKELNSCSTKLIKELIIPKLTKEINSSKRYAKMRQVYYSLVLSRWFKNKFKGQSGGYASRINTANLAGLTSQTPWSKDIYFKQYQQSFKDGEYNLKTPVYTPSGQVVRSYFSGGMNMGSSAMNVNNGFNTSSIYVPTSHNQAIFKGNAVASSGIKALKKGEEMVLVGKISNGFSGKSSRTCTINDSIIPPGSDSEILIYEDLPGKTREQIFTFSFVFGLVKGDARFFPTVVGKKVVAEAVVSDSSNTRPLVWRYVGDNNQLIVSYNPDSGLTIEIDKSSLENAEYAIYLSMKQEKSLSNAVLSDKKATNLKRGAVFAMLVTAFLTASIIAWKNINSFFVARKQVETESVVTSEPNTVGHTIELSDKFDGSSDNLISNLIEEKNVDRLFELVWRGDNRAALEGLIKLAQSTDEVGNHAFECIKQVSSNMYNNSSGNYYSPEINKRAKDFFANSTQHSSSPLNRDVGGLDWTVMQMTVKPLGSFADLNACITKLMDREVDNLNLVSEIIELNRLSTASIQVSDERLANFVIAAIKKGVIKQYRGDILNIFSKNCALQEETNCSASDEFKLALIVVNAE